MGIAQQLEPYIKSITSLMEQIQPEVGGSNSLQLPAMASEAGSVEPGSQPPTAKSSVNYSANNSAAIAASLGPSKGPAEANPPPANFSRQQQAAQPPFRDLMLGAAGSTAVTSSNTSHLLPERIQTAVSLAEYKTR